MDIFKVFRAIVGRLPIMARHRCNVCGHRVAKFIPYRQGSVSIPAFLRAVGFTGSDLDNFECPWCGATDRERHLFMYVTAAGFADELTKMEILHFAPEARFSRFVEDKRPVRYIKADLFPTGPDIQRIDMLDIPYPPASFDLVIANHVLEHVPDDIRALGEIRRVLRPGGLAILQTPFSKRLKHTWSDDGIDDDQSRLQAYGQEDHVRLFGTDLIDRFCGTGLISRVRNHVDLVPDFDAAVFGVNIDEPFLLFERPK